MPPLFSLTGADITSLLAWAGQFFNDIKLLVLILIALPVGWWIIKSILAAIFPKIDWEDYPHIPEEEKEIYRKKFED